MHLLFVISYHDLNYSINVQIKKLIWICLHFCFVLLMSRCDRSKMSKVSNDPVKKIDYLTQSQDHLQQLYQSMIFQSVIICSM
jgi:hypothetical protein